MQVQPAMASRARLGPAGRALAVSLVRCPTVTNVGAFGQDAVPPLGLAYVAAALREAGHDVTAVDAVGEGLDHYTRLDWTPYTLIHGLSEAEIVARINPKAEMIGISCMFSVEWIAVRDLASAIRRAFPRALIVFGGEHATACPEYSLQDCPAADMCVLGEGEETIVDVANALASGSDFSGVAGLVLRDGDRIYRTARRSRIRALDDIAAPDWSVFPITNYLDNRLSFGADLGRSMPILASRGCPYQCTFCSSPQMWTTLWRARSPQLLLAEMKHYMECYGVTNFDFYDLTAIVDRKWIVSFTQLLIDERLDITWQLPSGTRSEAIDETVCGLLYRSGCRVINYAPESGSEPELKRIKKVVKPERMLASMRAAHAAGLEIKANFIMGLPGSSWADVRRTFWFLARVAAARVDHVSAFPFSPYPGSELFDQLQREGRVTLDEAYFKSLLAYTDPQHSVSYTEFIGSRALSLLSLGAVAFFYAVSWTLRPLHAGKLLLRIAMRDSSTKLTTALQTRRRKRLALKTAKRQTIDRVILPALTKSGEGAGG
jgi:radical SAM superfamily enzyme YgiQ (UPF0313 family)